MKKSLLLSFVGTDRAGLTNDISNVIAKCNGNWMESRLVELSGKFAGILLINLPSANTEQLKTSLNDLPNSDLTWVIENIESTDSSVQPHRSMSLELVGNDRPGIVRDVTECLAKLKLNVEEMSSEFSDAPMSSEKLFKANIRVSTGLDETSCDDIQDALESLANELMIEIQEN